MQCTCPPRAPLPPPRACAPARAWLVATVVAPQEGLRNEMLPYGIRIQSAYPPNMDTPGFAEENKTKVSERALGHQCVHASERWQLRGRDAPLYDRSHQRPLP